MARLSTKLETRNHEHLLSGKYLPNSGEYFRVSPHIDEYYAGADLIISHGGAGTLLQNLYAGRMLVAVSNPTLLHNHQSEIVEKLDKEGYVLGFTSVAQMAASL